MDVVLNQTECRILGALAEKEMTTPDYYPLSLNSLENACNQKSNRQPVLNLTEAELVTALDRLRHLGLAMQSRSGGRVAKYSQTLREKLHLDEMELAILSELLLRGPQTVGELRGRADRMVRLENLETVETVLEELITRDPPLVAKLPRQAGRKESRYMHLLSGDTPEEIFCDEENSRGAVGPLEKEVAALRQELEALKEEFRVFRSQFD
ncbi:MAG: YceH family protein [Desulfuromonadales bacterium]|nr:YceH family protein [Desulfuromonadales bacterium]